MLGQSEERVMESESEKEAHMSTVLSPILLSVILYL